MAQAGQIDTTDDRVVRLPGKRKKPYRGGTLGGCGFTFDTLPPNVTPIRQYSWLYPRIERVMPPSGYLVAALISAMGDKRGGRKPCDKVLDALHDMLLLYSEDPDVRASIREAVDMFFYSKKTGRF